MAAKERQPGSVRAVRVFKAHHITVLYRSAIRLSVTGEYLKSGVRIFEPIVSPQSAVSSTETTTDFTYKLFFHFQ